MRIPHIITSHKKLTGFLTLLLVLLIALGLFMFFKGSAPVTLPQQERHYSVLTGEEIDADAAGAQILAVMVENSEAARPQTGLDSAGIVFETTTEAGITRYLALYDHDFPDEIAPVRSVRPAFVDWLMGFDAAVAHVGGSAPALEMLEQRNAKDLDEFKFPDPYFRGENREAPHNMHVKLSELLQLMEEQDYRSSDVAHYPRQDNTPVESPDATEISVSFSSPEFDTSYAYDASTNTYTRSLASQPHIDTATQMPITVANVIVIDLGSNVKALGQGKATIFRDGTAISGIWRQENYTDKISFYEVLDGVEQEVPLNRGDTWIAAITSMGSVDY